LLINKETKYSNEGCNITTTDVGSELPFYVIGNSYRTLQYFFRVSKSSISKFIPEASDEIYDSLREFIKVSK